MPLCHFFIRGPVPEVPFFLAAFLTAFFAADFFVAFFARPAVPAIRGPVPEVPRCTLAVRFVAASSAATFSAVFAVRLLVDFFVDFSDVFFATIFDRPFLLFPGWRWTSLLAGSSTASFCPARAQLRSVA